MKKSLVTLCALLTLSSVADAKPLVAYYSRTGNTATLAEKIATATGADTFRIETADTNHYPDDYTETTKIAQDEINNDTVVEINVAPDLTEYDTIFIGTPVWWGTMSTPVKSFLRKNDLSDKVIVPFVTHGGGGASNTFTNIATESRGAKNLAGLEIPGNTTQTADDEIAKWLSVNKLK